MATDWGCYTPKARAFLRLAYKHVGVGDLDQWPGMFYASDSVTAWRKACDRKLHAFVKLCRQLHPRPNTPKGYGHLTAPRENTRRELAVIGTSAA